jgi:hypothetical protein
VFRITTFESPINDLGLKFESTTAERGMSSSKKYSLMIDHAHGVLGQVCHTAIHRVIVKTGGGKVLGMNQLDVRLGAPRKLLTDRRRFRRRRGHEDAREWGEREVDAEAVPRGRSGWTEHKTMSTRLSGKIKYAYHNRFSTRRRWRRLDVVKRTTAVGTATRDVCVEG